LASGHSSCESLRLKTYAVRERDRTVWLRTAVDDTPAPAVHTLPNIAVHPLKSRPRLTVNVLTRNSENRLKRLLDEAAAFADEVLVGVDT